MALRTLSLPDVLTETNRESQVLQPHPCFVGPTGSNHSGGRVCASSLGPGSRQATKHSIIMTISTSNTAAQVLADSMGSVPFPIRTMAVSAVPPDNRPAEIRVQHYSERNRVWLFGGRIAWRTLTVSMRSASPHPSRYAAQET